MKFLRAQIVTTEDALLKGTGFSPYIWHNYGPRALAPEGIGSEY